MSNTKVVTGKVRFSYAHIFEPVVPASGGDAKYSVSLLIPKSDKATVAAMTAAVAAARDNFCAKNGASALPAKPTTTIHDGDGMRDNGESYGSECAGCWVLSVSSKNKPVVVGPDLQPIIDPGEVYSGCYGRAAINFFAYSKAGKKGISAGLLSIQKLEDGEAFGTVGSADDFADGFSAGAHAAAAADEEIPW